MKPGFAGDPVASTLFFLTILVWVVIEARQGLRRRTGATSNDRASLLVLRVCGVVGALLAVVALKVGVTSYAFNPFLFAVGVVLMWSGIALRWWAFHTLGRYFTFTVMTSPDQQVITAGPYRVLRHPSYTGILLILLGVGFSYNNWLSLVALVGAVLVGVIYRIRVEEAALAATIGDAYTTFARNRRRLIPFVW